MTMTDLSEAREQWRKLEGEVVAFKRFRRERAELETELPKILSQVNLILHEEPRSAEEPEPFSP
jgi:hypothetical protein